MAYVRDLTFILDGSRETKAALAALKARSGDIDSPSLAPRADNSTAAGSLRRNADVAAEMRAAVEARLRHSTAPIAVRYKQLQRIAKILERAPDDRWFAADVRVASLHSLQLFMIEAWANYRYPRPGIVVRG